MPNKKNMAARYASTHARREARRRSEDRSRTLDHVDRAEPGIAAGLGTAPRDAGMGVEQATSVPRGVTVPVAPRTTRQPVARPAATPRTAVGRAPLRPTSGLATVVDYSYLAGDLRRIVLLSAALFVMLVVLNLLLNH